MVELPTGSYSKGLGVGKTWYKFPIWIQKDLDPWTTYGGAGYQVVHQIDYKNFPYARMAATARYRRKMDSGRRALVSRAEGLATIQAGSATCLISAGTTTFASPRFSCCSAWVTPIVGHSETYAYLGLYWTWGKKEADSGAAKVAWSETARAPTALANPSLY